MAKLKVFEEMKTERDPKRWKELKEQYDAYDKMECPGGRLSRSEILTGAVSIASVLLVLHYEKLDVIVTKAFSWVRPKQL